MSEVRTSARAWVDAEDAEANVNMPQFLKQSHVTPSWALPDTQRERGQEEGEEEDGSQTATSANVVVSSSVEAASRKRFRSTDLDALLSRTEPLLSSRHDRSHLAAPRVLSVLPLPRDGARTVEWHRNGQLAIVGGNHHIYAFHTAGRYVEQLSKVDVGSRVEQAALTSTGEEVIVAGHECYAPQLLSLTTEKLLPLRFLDTRDTAVHRNGRRDNNKSEFYITRLVPKPGDVLSKVVALASGCSVRLGSLTSGSVVDTITVDAAVTDMCFSSVFEVTIAAGNKLRVFDVRKSSRFFRDITDEGSLGITSFAASSTSLAVGSSSGVVNLYDRASTTKPLRVMKNLTTPIHTVCFGENSSGESVLAFSSKGQKAAFRLATLPDCRVLPSFPAGSLHHSYIQSMCIAPTVPVLSVGERQKVTNYAL